MMVCKNCRRKKHKLCPGGTWCVCQHDTEGVNWQLVRRPETVVVPPTTRPVDC